MLERECAIALMTMGLVVAMLTATLSACSQDGEKKTVQRIEDSRTSADQDTPAAVPGQQKLVEHTAREIKIRNEGRDVIASVLEPATLAKDPLLIVELCWESFSNPDAAAIAFHSRALRWGHRILRMDVPQEGSRSDSFGWAMVGMNAALAAHRDIFGEFVRDGRALIDKCIADGLAKPGRIVAAGISRGGFSAAHLMAADSRISAGAFFAPVTTLSALEEFRENRNSGAVTRLDLWKLARKLAGRRVWMGIGHADSRVDTTAACRFYMALRKAEACPLAESKIDFYITEDEDHTFDKRWYERAASSLIETK